MHSVAKSPGAQKTASGMEISHRPGRSISSQVALVLHGQEGAGKGVIVQALMHLVGSVLGVNHVHIK